MNRQRRHRPELVLLLVGLSCGLPSVGAAASGRVGVLPTHDLSGSRHGTVVARSLQSTLLELLSKKRIHAVYLNPGPLFSASDPESYLEQARELGVDAVLVTTLTEDGRDPLRMGLKGFLVTPNGDRSPGFSTIATIKPRDAARGGWVFDGASFFGSSREFNKQKLGKVAKKLAKGITPGALTQIHESVSTRAAVPASPGKGECQVKVRVRYKDTGKASKRYVLIFNKLEESLGVVNGVATISTRAGPYVVHLSVKDQPFGLIVQDSYSFNGDIDCDAGDRTMWIEIGHAGEGNVIWDE